MDRGMCASEHGIMEERLMNNVQDIEANKVNAEELVGTPTNRGKLECTDQEASIANDVNSGPEKVNRPKRRVLKKKIGVCDEAKLQPLIGNEASDDADEAGTNEGLKNDKKTVPEEPSKSGEHSNGSEIDVEENMNIDEGLFASEHVVMEEKLMENLHNEDANKFNAEEPIDSPTDNEKIECIGEDASITNEAKSVPEKIVISKREVLEKEVATKEMLVYDDIAFIEDSIPGALMDDEASGEGDKEDTNEDVKNDENAVSADRGKIELTVEDVNTSGNMKLGPEKANEPKRKVLKKKVVKKVVPGVAVSPTDVAKLEVSNDHDASGKANKVDTKKDEKTEITPAVSTKRKGVRKRVSKGQAKNPGSSEKSNNSGRTDSTGMIFMCNSETKKECYLYKVLGLPAGKKDTVLKIYKSMKLFLFDVDQRMMYGIYKAVSPGGYNIEPRAFNRQFPSQVRFTVLRDCLPLAEEKFKTAISDNYYTKNKFSFQLTAEQVKNLCKLFTETSQRAEPKPVATNPITQISTVPSSRKRKRTKNTGQSRHNDRLISGNTDSRILSAELERNRRRRTHEEVTRPYQDVRQAAPIVIDDRYNHHNRPFVVYDYPRESYVPTRVYQQLPPQSYSYGYQGSLARIEDTHRRGDSWALEHRQGEAGRSSRGWERPVANVDVPYRERHAYWEPRYETTEVRREGEYESAIRPTEYYTVSGSYRPPLGPYGR